MDRKRSQSRATKCAKIVENPDQKWPKTGPKIVRNRATKWSKIDEKRGPEMIKNRAKNSQKLGQESPKTEPQISTKPSRN